MIIFVSNVVELLIKNKVSDDVSECDFPHFNMELGFYCPTMNN